MPRYEIRTYKTPIPKKLYSVCEELNKTAARIYNKALSITRKTKNKKGYWLSESSVKKYIRLWASDIEIHSQSKQAFVEEYFHALKSYLKAVRTTSNAKPPYKTKKYLPFVWKGQTIKLMPDGTLKLPMGRHAEPLLIPTKLLPDTVIKLAKLIYENGKYYLHLAIEVKIENEKVKERTNVVSVDLGILRPITAFDGKQVITYHGGELSSKLRYKNKRLADIQCAMSKCKKDSKRYRKLKRAKKHFLSKINNQIRDILHKITSHFINWCIQQNACTIVIGDITNIRQDNNKGKLVNQRLHQWMFRKIITMIKNKAELFDIKVKLISEAYTSKTCPICGTLNNIKDRNYKCACGFEYHRDGVGAINIYKKYLGDSQVVADLAPAVGVRFHSHLRGHGVKYAPWKLAISQ